MRLRRRFYSIFASGALLLLGLLNWRAHAPANHDDIISQLRFICRELQ